MISSLTQCSGLEIKGQELLSCCPLLERFNDSQHAPLPPWVLISSFIKWGGIKIFLRFFPLLKFYDLTNRQKKKKAIPTVNSKNSLYVHLHWFLWMSRMWTDCALLGKVTLNYSSVMEFFVVYSQEHSVSSLPPTQVQRGYTCVWVCVCICFSEDIPRLI